MRLIRMEAYVHTAWWLRFYILGLSWMCGLTGRAHHPEGLDYWMRRAIKVKFREINCE